MSERDWLAKRFESHRGHLRGVAYRMLGRLSDADDAVQEAWLRLNRSGAEGIDNLGGWLTTTVARVCLDVLRARKSRKEASPGARETDASPRASEPPLREVAAGPEQEAVLAESVGLALLIVLDALAPAERVSFVLHDLFGISFEDIAPIVGRTAASARQLASRARRRVRGKAPNADMHRRDDPSREREVVEAFLAASQRGDFVALLNVLDPQVEFRPDLARPLAGPKETVRGAETVAKLFSGRAQAARAALVDGAVGIVVAPRGRLLLALAVRIEGGKILRIEAIAEPARLGALTLGVLPELR